MITYKTLNVRCFESIRKLFEDSLINCFDSKGFSDAGDIFDQLHKHNCVNWRMVWFRKGFSDAGEFCDQLCKDEYVNLNR